MEVMSEGRRCNLLIHPPRGLRSDLAKVGWITSAYLLAFYTFGYRYIVHEFLDPVRKYMLSSFEDIESRRVEFPELDSLSVHECSEHHVTDPEVVLVIPLDETSQVHLQVNFLDYHVILPFHFVTEVLQVILSMESSAVDGLPEAIGKEGARLCYRIDCNKSDGHDCMWDYVLGKPIPGA